MRHFLLAATIASATAIPFGLSFAAATQEPAAPAGEAVSESTAPTPWFREAAAETGLAFTYRSGAEKDSYRFPEIMGGGVGLFDYDGDGLLDIYLVQGGQLVVPEGETNAATNRLFQNSPEGKFTDVTDAAGVGHNGYGMGVACGDYDRDGDVDLFVTNIGANTMYQNQGNGTFKDVTAKIGVGDIRWGTSAAFLDIDGDKDLDLFVANNLNWAPPIEVPCFNYYGEPDYCSPTNYNAASPDILYQQGRIGFSNITALSGVGLSSGNGLGVAIGDYDNDGDSDIYVANDATANVLWTSLGRAKYKDQGLIKGCAVNGNGTAEAGMGVQFVDIDMDGDLDLFMTHLRRETNTFYLNARGRFTDRTAMTGVAQASLKMTGFGTAFHDFDLDGLLDLYVVNGSVQAWKEKERFDQADPYAEPNHLFRGEGKTRFAEIPDGGVMGNPIATSRGAAFGDLDNDGDIDIVIANRDSSVSLLINEAPRLGSWIGFYAKGPKNNPIPGAKVEVHFGEKVLHRLADPAYSYLASNDPRTHFGLGQDAEGNPVAAIEKVVVRWPGGRVESFGAKEVGAYHELIKGRGEKEGE